MPKIYFHYHFNSTYDFRNFLSRMNEKPPYWTIESYHTTELAGMSKKSPDNIRHDVLVSRELENIEKEVKDGN